MSAKSQGHEATERIAAATEGPATDAVATTIEYVEGGGFTRVRQNLLRWSGNLLRNGWRCIALGPDHLGLFTWWCFIDQRIAMWTTLIGPVLAVNLIALQGLSMFMTAVVYVLVTRFLLSLFLYYYAGRIYVSFPWLLYLNQITNSAVKVYLLFRLAEQRWRNRADQGVEKRTGWFYRYQTITSFYVTGLYLTAFAFALFVFFFMPDLPPLQQVLQVVGLR